MPDQVLASRLSNEKTCDFEFPLGMTAAGDKIIVQKIRGGKKLNKRLSDLGVHPGSKLKVVKVGESGPMIVAVKKDSRFAIGRGMAQKIIVKTLIKRKS